MKIIHILILSMLYALSLHAADRDSVLLRAEQFYQQNEFSKSIVEYQSLADSGWVSAELFYNLGNADMDVLYGRAVEVINKMQKVV